MSKTLNQIENYIQLHTAEMEDVEYLSILQEIVKWANKQIRVYELRGYEALLEDSDDE